MKLCLKSLEAYGAGSKSRRARRSEADVVQIFERVANGEPLPAVAEDCKITLDSLRDIIRRRRWTHVEIDDGLAERAQARLQSAAVLAASDIPKIFELKGDGLATPEIAEKFGVKPKTIAAVLRRDTWKNVHVPYSTLRKAK